MRLKALVSFACAECSPSVGQEFSCSTETGEALISAGYAEEVDDEDKRADISDDMRATKGERAGAKRRGKAAD